jgi:competence protein ComEC
MASLTVLDVGHGSSTIVSDAGKVVIIDTADRTRIQGYLQQSAITDIELIVISHSDQDHIGGLLNLLSDERYSIKRLVINSDSIKDSSLWEDIRFLVDEQEREGKIVIDVAVATPKGSDWQKVTDDLNIEVVSPTRAMLLSGAGQSMPKDERKLTTNSVSVVVRVVYRGEPIALVTGDMDSIALDAIAKSAVDITAPYLIFPHHGGSPGKGQADKFTSELLAKVNPKTVIFSNGRTKYNNPHPEIVDSALRNIPDLKILCTQLSKTCCAEVKRLNFTPHVYSFGAQSGASCAGSIEIDLATLELHSEARDIHVAYIETLPSALCAKRTTQT